MLLYLFVRAVSLFLSLLFQLLLPLTSSSKKKSHIRLLARFKKNLLISLNLHVTALRSVKNDAIIAPGDIQPLYYVTVRGG